MSDEHTQKIPNSDVKRILAQLDSINARLMALEQNAQARAYDTKPIWERALQEIAETRQEVAETRAEMRAGFEKMDVRFEALEQKIEVLADDVLTVRAKYKNIDSRLRRLESEPTQ